ncbi:hypothetical protein NMN79_004465 [Salmonella enterica]|nr:hypothetical protein [Salmonella enterica]
MTDVNRKFFTDARSSVAIFIPVYDCKGEVCSIAPAGEFAEHIISSLYLSEETAVVTAYKYGSNIFIAMRDEEEGDFYIMVNFFCDSFQGFIFVKHNDPVKGVKDAYLTTKALYAMDDYECEVATKSTDDNKSNWLVINHGLIDARRSMPKEEPQKLC